MIDIHIIGGGTVHHVRNHLALTAPAYGTTARNIDSILYQVAINHSHLWTEQYSTHLHLTKMANQGKGDLETNGDIARLIDKLCANPVTKIIFFNPALVDFEGSIATSGAMGYEWGDDIPTPSGKYEERLKTSLGNQKMILTPAQKIISKIRKTRKDIFLVGFKTTCGASEDDQFLTGLNLLKSSSCNLVLANDTKTRTNMIITPEQARYSVTTDRSAVLNSLVEMTLERSKSTFTRSTIVGDSSDSVAWTEDNIPPSLKKVVDHCIAAGAYKTFRGATVGHFAFKVSENSFITSKRKVNFNDLSKIGMVLCMAVNDDKVIAYGSKPSVGGQSQRIIFKDHPGTDCIVHFHCPPKPGAQLSVRSQKNFECGSHECGKNTSQGLREEVPGIKCVFLDNHGPNIVFNKSIDPQVVIDFINKNFDLSKSTDGIDREKMVVS